MGGIVIEKSRIKKILTNSGEFDSDGIKDICQIIAGSYSGSEASIIHSELDADRFDYLLRDSKHTGVTYGLFDIDRIIHYLNYTNSAEEGSGLFIERKAQKAVEDFLMARYFLYSTVIFQKTSIGFQKMAEIVYSGLLEREKVHSYFDLVRFFDDFSKQGSFYDYMNYDDNYMIQIMKSVVKGEIKVLNDENYQINSDLIKICCEKLLKREPLKLVAEEQKIINKNDVSSLELETYTNRKKYNIFINHVIDNSKIEDYWYITSQIEQKITSLSASIPLSELNQYDPNVHNNERINVQKNNGAIIPLVEDDASIIKSISDKKLKIIAIYTKNEEYKDRILKNLQINN